MRSCLSLGPLHLRRLSALSNLFTKSSSKAAWEVGLAMEPASQGRGAKATHSARLSGPHDAVSAPPACPASG